MPLHQILYKDFDKYFQKNQDTVFFFDYGKNKENLKIKEQVDRLMATLKKIHFIELNFGSCPNDWKKAFYDDPNMFFHTKFGYVHNNKSKPSDEDIISWFNGKEEKSKAVKDEKKKK